jgi:hypothetical protein
MQSGQLKELVLQSLEHERGGVLIYETALDCVINPELRDEWQRYLQQTKSHVTALEKICDGLSVDPEEQTAGRRVAHHMGKALVDAMKMALAEGQKEAAELVAADCVILAETKDHADWQLLGKCAGELTGDTRSMLEEAYNTIEEQEDEHLYHSKGWGRELWLKSLGLDAVLPPPEEEKDVRSAAAAAKAEGSRRH